MRTLSRYQYERGLPARRLVDCINMLAVSEGVEEGAGGKARVAIPRQEQEQAGRQLRYLIVHAKLKLNYLPTRL